MHFLRTSKLVVDAYTTSINTIEVAPIDYGSSYLPAWWKALPKQTFVGSEFYPSPTMKTCVGMHHYYARSLVIPLWSDLHIKVEDGTYVWQFSDKESVGEVHSSTQFMGFSDPTTCGHLKLISPWKLKTKNQVDWIMSQPTYNMANIFDYTVCPGMLDFSKQHATNIQMMLNLSENKVIELPFRTPLVTLTPMSDKEIVLRRHLVSHTEANLLNAVSTPISFINKYILRNRVSAVCPYKDHIRK